MRDNKKVLEKIKKMNNAVNPELETTEAFRASSREVMAAALKSVQDAINPVTDAELIFLIPALMVVTDSLEYFLDGEARSREKSWCGSSDLCFIRGDGVRRYGRIK